MDNYTLEIPYKEDETCPDCGRETEKGYQCSTCIKRYEEEIEKQARIEERYQYRQWRNDSGV